MAEMTTQERVMSNLRETIEQKPVRSTHKECGKLVQDLTPFRASNMYADWIFPEPKEESPLYVVFSYGEHYPMYIFEPIEGTWFRNATGYSNSTAKHEIAANPGQALPLDCDSMSELVVDGIETFYRNRTGETYVQKN